MTTVAFLVCFICILCFCDGFAYSLYWLILKEICGKHLRSYVHAYELLKEGGEPKLQYLVTKMKERLDQKLDEDTEDAIADYVFRSISNGRSVGAKDIEEMVGDGSVTPIMILIAFQTVNTRAADALSMMFGSFSFVDGGACRSQMLIC